MKRILIIIVIILTVTALAAGFFLFTSKGGETLLTGYVKRQLDAEVILSSRTEGSLAEGISLSNLELTEVKYLPEGSIVRLQDLYFNFHSFDPNDWELRVENLRVALPDSDPIVVEGAIEKGFARFNVYSRAVTIRELERFFPGVSLLAETTGVVNELDVHLSGSLENPAVTGGLLVEELTHKKVVLNNVPVKIDMRLVKGDSSEYSPSGVVSFSGGTVSLKTVRVKLRDSQVRFSGSWEDPSLSIQGDTVIEKIKINIRLTGTVKNPDLKLSSDPSLPEGKLLLMVATGKSWQGLDSAVNDKTLSPDLAKDFIDYFVLGGAGSTMAKRFGISSVSLQYNEQGKGFKATKELTDKLEVGYGLKEKVTDKNTKEINQSVSGEYQVTDGLSVGVEKEIKPAQEKSSQDPLAQPETGDKPNDKVYLKYKKNF